jgi:hypothetical protein
MTCFEDLCPSNGVTNKPTIIIIGTSHTIAKVETLQGKLEERPLMALVLPEDLVKPPGAQTASQMNADVQAHDVYATVLDYNLHG